MAPEYAIHEILGCLRRVEAIEKTSADAVRHHDQRVPRHERETRDAHTQQAGLASA